MRTCKRKRIRIIASVYSLDVISIIRTILTVWVTANSVFWTGTHLGPSVSNEGGSFLQTLWACVRIAQSITLALGLLQGTEIMLPFPFCVIHLLTPFWRVQDFILSMCQSFFSEFDPRFRRQSDSARWLIRSAGSSVRVLSPWSFSSDKT